MWNLFKVNDNNTKMTSSTYSGVFIVKFEHIFKYSGVFILTLNK